METNKDKIRLLDGGMATELATTYRHDIHGDPLWSARVITTHPQDIAHVHQSYLEVGCDVLETATYQASLEGLQRHLSIDFQKAFDIIKQAVDICLKTRDEFWSKAKKTGHKKPLVAGSLGPYGAHLADGSEYNGCYADRLSIEELADWHRPQVDAIWRNGVDLLAFETIPSQKEANAIVRVLEEFPDSRAWISFSCQNGKQTCHGDDIGAAMMSLMLSNQIVGCGVNCTAPSFVESLLENVPSVVKQTKTILVYPNSGETWTEDKRWSKTDASRVRQLEDCVSSWIEGGASWIGGCCQVTPNDIALVRTAIDRYCDKLNSPSF